MTLVVSVRVPDGVVLAVDSLTVTRGKVAIEADIETKCTHCGKKITIPKFTPPPIEFPSSTSVFAQKLFSIKGRFGIGAYGGTTINRQGMYSQMKRFEQQLPDDITSVDEIAKHVKAYFMTEFQSEIGDLSKLPDGYLKCGFQVVGYSALDSVMGRTCAISIGTEVKGETWDTFGCTVSGDRGVVLKLWQKDKNMPVPTPIYEHFSLQEAIDYAEFLIRTTADYQRFANMIPTVGGEADVAVVTPHSGFTWIKSKQLTKLLESR